MVQEERRFEAQRAEQWLPAVGAIVHVPRLGGNAKVSPLTCECCHFSLKIFKLKKVLKKVF